MRKSADRYSPPMATVRNFIVIGAAKSMVIQVLLAIHAYTDARCLVMCAKGTRFLRSSILCSEYLEADFCGEDDNRLVDIINRHAEATPDVTLIPADCAGSRTIDRVRNRLRVAIAPSPTSSMLDCFDDKWRFYQFCRAHELNTPATRFVGNKKNMDFASTALELGIPFVIKPVNQDSSRGTYIISSEEEFRQKILNDDSYQYAPLIAQRYILGIDVGLNLLSVNGKVRMIAIQQRIQPEHDGSKIKFFPNAYLESAAHVVCRESGYDGVMNIDARIEHGTGKVFLFESNPRFWRSLSASVWCGFNFAADCIEQAQRQSGIKILTSGSADTYYHPLFRPALWLYALFDKSYRGRMVRLMTIEICTLFTSVRIHLARARTAGQRIFTPAFQKLMNIAASVRSILLPTRHKI
jgi:predicted ATP-grasp superfamily ATP-dependent carboligase